jgi:hypothetical protein
MLLDGCDESWARGDDRAIALGDITYPLIGGRRTARDALSSARAEERDARGAN